MADYQAVATHEQIKPPFRSGLLVSSFPLIQKLLMSSSTPYPSLSSLLSTLKALVKRLPPSSPPAPKNGLVHEAFSNFDVPEGEGPYYAVDQAWTRAFQGKSNVAIGGRYGVGVVYNFFVYFSKQELGCELSLLELRVQQFIELVKEAYVKPGSLYTGTDTSLNPCLQLRRPRYYFTRASGTRRRRQHHPTARGDDRCVRVPWCILCDFNVCQLQGMERTMWRLSKMTPALSLVGNQRKALTTMGTTKAMKSLRFLPQGKAR